jgi:hypothetical protein
MAEKKPIPWAVTRWWPGDTVVIIGSGPSLTCAQVAHVWLARKQDGCRVIAVNDNYRIAPWADLLYACDYNFFQANWRNLEHFHGRIYTTDKKAAETWDRLRWIPGGDKPGLSFDPEYIHWGRNSGYHALNIAVLAGASKVLLVGFDHHVQAGKQHWFKNQGHHNISLYNRWFEKWQSAKPDLEKAGCRVINCTPETALTCFDCSEIETELTHEN